MILHNGQSPLKARAIVREARAARKPERPLPPKLEMARTAAISVGQAIQSRFKTVSDEEKARRLAICEGCEFFRPSDRRCSKCGCALKWKSRLEAWHCPIAKW